MLYLVTFSGMAESEQGSTNLATSRQEEEELLAQMEEDERLLDESYGEDKQSAATTKERAIDIVLRHFILPFRTVLLTTQ